MTIARAHLVDPAVSRWYHCVTRCVRRAFLLGDEHAGPQILDRTPAPGTCGDLRHFRRRVRVLDNHLHLLVRLDPALGQGWSDEEVVRRWGRLFPPRDKARQALPVTEDWVQARLKEAGWVAKARQRLQSLSWFMKCLKEPLARLANRQDETRGAFFEGRFKSVAILDDEALLTVCAYIDLNPVAAGIAEVPETSEHTSIKQRVDHVQAQGRTDDLASGPGRQRGGLGGRGGHRGVALALPDRRPAWRGFIARGDDRGLLAGQLPAAGGLHRAAVSRGESDDLARGGRDLAADRQQCG